MRIRRRRVRQPEGAKKTRVRHLGIALGVVAVACSRDPKLVERPVYLNFPAACPANASDAYSLIYAGGDFEPSIARPPTASFFLRQSGQPMDDLPEQTRSLVADVSQKDGDWRGIAGVRETGPINLLLWPQGASCQLTQDLERRSDMALGVFGHQFMVSGGRSVGLAQVPNTYVGDLTTGSIARLAFGPSTRRSHATITEFRARAPGDSDPEAPSAALVAGGDDPESNAVVLDTAEVYVPELGAPGDIGDFDRERITLSEPRTEHGAVVLTTGETLLVGGRGSNGLLDTMEVVDPATRHARPNGLALLAVPRKTPTVLRLASGEILVAGGVDTQGAPIATLEWFSADASHATKRPLDLVTGRERALVPLDGGGALAVIIPETPTPDFKTVWSISSAGTAEPALPIDPTTLDVVRLFPGSEGSPVLWTGRRWLRWSPWVGAFLPIDDAPAAGPALDAIASGDRGLALWLDDRSVAPPGLYATGYRFSVRTAFDAVPNPLLVQGPDNLAPDRLAGLPGSSLHFEPSAGLTLGPGTSAFVTDVTFADFDLDVDVVPNDAPPVVVLRDESGAEFEIGGAACAYGRAVRSTISVRRRDRRIDVAVDGGAARTCATSLSSSTPTPAPTRVSIGLRGASGGPTSGARNLRILRSP